MAILDATGSQLASGVTGEVAIKGPNVTRGYENNPEANATAFVNGWFRTGDQGYFDEEGYLFITGRLKELINRGGEKIAPREIDEALLAHPWCRQAVAFSVPHPSLGEDVSAAVVLRAGASRDEAGLRAYLLDQLLPSRYPAISYSWTKFPRGLREKFSGLAWPGGWLIPFRFPTKVRSQRWKSKWQKPLLPFSTWNEWDATITFLRWEGIRYEQPRC